MSRPTFLAVLLCGALSLVTPASAPAQTPAGPTEGFRLDPDPSVPGGRILSWWGQPGRTYFVQQSDDLNLWTYLPVIEPGAGQLIQWGFTSTQPQLFVRLKYTDIPSDDPFDADFDGDGVSNWNELLQGTDPLSAVLDINGLPLDWETYFAVPAGTNANLLTPANDGFTYSQAFQLGVDPSNDYFAGQTPTLSITDGNRQTGNPNGFVPKALVVQVSDPNGLSLTNAPVQFTVTQGSGQVRRSSSGTPASAVVVLSDANGQAKVFFQLPGSQQSQSQITAAAGNGNNTSQVSFQESSDDGSGTFSDAFAPSNVVAALHPDGSMDITWQNNTDDPAEIPIQVEQPDGTWGTPIMVPAGTTSLHLPPP